MLQDQLILLAVREVYALYGSPATEDDDYLITEVAQILAVDPDSEINRKKTKRALDTFRVEHDPARRDVESLEAAWCLITNNNAPLLNRLVSHYAVSNQYVTITPRKKAS
jgi:hypothetical protein